MTASETGPRASTPIELLRASGVTFSVMEHVPIFGRDDAERELGLAADQLVKTMVFRAGDKRILVALPVHGRVNYGKLARAVGIPRGQLRQAGPDDLRSLGMEPGGASPVCGVAGVITVFDVTVSDMGKVFCGSGRADVTVEIHAADLIDVVRPVMASVI